MARARDDGILQPASQSPVGSALLTLLKAAVLRVAVTVGGADPSLNAQSTTSLFNLSGSGVATRRLYDGGISLPSKLPWAKAKTLVGTMLDALSIFGWLSVACVIDSRATALWKTQSRGEAGWCARTYYCASQVCTPPGDSKKVEGRPPIFL